jgi:two-component system chemotaxis response regulator CheB
MKKSRIIVATPSLIDQSRLERSLVGSCKFDLVAQTQDLSATYSKVEEMMPDLVVIAETFQSQAEYRCMESLFQAVEARVVTLRSLVTESNSGLALANGAIHARMDEAKLVEILMSAPKNKASTLPIASLPPQRYAQIAGQFQHGKTILIGASTGGIDALTTILQHFPQDCPPTAIVQHTGQNFSETLAQLLDRRCAAEVVLAETGLVMQPGRIVLAGGIDGHLTLERGSQFRCKVSRGPATSGHIPSIDELFASAVPFAKNVVAALLTGMGRDGASGLLQLHKAGAVTIGQDQETSVVYGMPRVAFEMGAVQQQLPLSEIGRSIIGHCENLVKGLHRVGK